MTAVRVANSPRKNGKAVMIRWALVFLVIGLIAGLLGFSGIAGTAIGIAKILFFVAITIFVVMLLLGYTVFRRNP